MRYGLDDYLFHNRDVRDSDKSYFGITTHTTSAECKHCGGRGPYVMLGDTSFVNGKARMVTASEVGHTDNCALIKAAAESRRT